MASDFRLLDKNNDVIIDPLAGVLLPPPAEEAEEVDTYDQGSRGFNYRSERLLNRFLEKPVLHDLFSSRVFKDPATPLFESYVGDPITIRLITPAERRRAHTFHLHGHRWRFEAMNINSRTESFSGFNIAGANQNLEILGGAGAYKGFPGDYMYRSGNIMWDIEQGMWGIMRVYKELNKLLPPLNE